MWILRSLQWMGLWQSPLRRVVEPMSPAGEWECDQWNCTPDSWTPGKNTQKTASSNTAWWFHPLWKILVSWDDYSQYMQIYAKIKNVWNQQPAFLLRLSKTAFWKYDHQGRSNVWLEDFPAIFGLAVWIQWKDIETNQNQQFKLVV